MRLPPAGLFDIQHSTESVGRRLVLILHFLTESACNASTILSDGVYVDCNAAEVGGAGGKDKGEATAVEALAASVPPIGCGGAIY